MSKPVICVTEKEYHKAQDVFDCSEHFKCLPVSLVESKLARSIRQYNAFGVILGVDSFENELYEALPKGGIIARFGVGHDGVDKEKATAQRLIVTNTPGVLDDSVAEHAIWLMGSLARKICDSDRAMKARRWSPANGYELRAKTLLIYGCGPIGCKTAAIASFGFGMNVIGCDIADLPLEKLKKEFGFSAIVKDAGSVLPKADFVSIHLPSLPATHHFINADFLGKMKPGACLINTSRGALINEADLYDILKSGRIAAALDVYETEPYEPVDPEKDLRSLDNLIMTPHIGSSTNEACQRMAASCLANIIAAYEKRYGDLQILNPEVVKPLM